LTHRLSRVHLDLKRLRLQCSCCNDLDLHLDCWFSITITHNRGTRKFELPVEASCAHARAKYNQLTGTVTENTHGVNNWGSDTEEHEQKCPVNYWIHLGFVWR
jgi:hypothetical protein